LVQTQIMHFSAGREWIIEIVDILKELKDAETI
jgi:hypothetical protein